MKLKLKQFTFQFMSELTCSVDLSEAHIIRSESLFGWLSLFGKSTFVFSHLRN